jgi:hypothetical protein
VVLVLDQQRQRGAGGQPAHHTAQDLDRVVLQFHARPGAVAVLAARQVVVDQGRGERQPGRQALENGNQGRPV